MAIVEYNIKCNVCSGDQTYEYNMRENTNEEIYNHCTCLDRITPVETFDNICIKRDDLFSIAGVGGGKARTCFHLAQDAKGLVTAGSRMSPQVNIVAHIAKYLGIPCIIHTPMGELSPEVKMAVDCGSEIRQHKAGYNSVIKARARECANETGYTLIPFGMECWEAVEQTKRQVINVPPNAKRIIVPVGSAMSMCGILWGLKENNLNIPVVGISVGADPKKILEKYAPPKSQYTIIKANIDYHKNVLAEIGNIKLDPVYEAKCFPYIESGDLFWIVGVRKSLNNK